MCVSNVINLLSDALSSVTHIVRSDLQPRRLGGGQHGLSAATHIDKTVLALHSAH